MFLALALSLEELGDACRARVESGGTGQDPLLSFLVGEDGKVSPSKMATMLGGCLRPAVYPDAASDEDPNVLEEFVLASFAAKDLSYPLSSFQGGEVMVVKESSVYQTAYQTLGVALEEMTQRDALLVLRSARRSLLSLLLPGVVEPAIDLQVAVWLQSLEGGAALAVALSLLHPKSWSSGVVGEGTPNNIMSLTSRRERGKKVYSATSGGEADDFALSLLKGIKSQPRLRDFFLAELAKHLQSAPASSSQRSSQQILTLDPTAAVLVAPLYDLFVERRDDLAKKWSNTLASLRSKRQQVPKEKRKEHRSKLKALDGAVSIIDRLSPESVSSSRRRRPPTIDELRLALENAVAFLTAGQLRRAISNWIVAHVDAQQAPFPSFTNVNDGVTLDLDDLAGRVRALVLDATVASNNKIVTIDVLGHQIRVVIADGVTFPLADALPGGFSTVISAATSFLLHRAASNAASTAERVRTRTGIQYSPTPPTTPKDPKALLSTIPLSPGPDDSSFVAIGRLLSSLLYSSSSHYGLFLILSSTLGTTPIPRPRTKPRGLRFDSKTLFKYSYWASSWLSARSASPLSPSSSSPASSSAATPPTPTPSAWGFHSLGLYNLASLLAASPDPTSILTSAVYMGDGETVSGAVTTVLPFIPALVEVLNAALSASRSHNLSYPPDTAGLGAKARLSTADAKTMLLLFGAVVDEWISSGSLPPTSSSASSSFSSTARTSVTGSPTSAIKRRALLNRIFDPQNWATTTPTNLAIKQIPILVLLRIIYLPNVDGAVVPTLVRLEEEEDLAFHRRRAHNITSYALSPAVFASSSSTLASSAHTSPALHSDLAEKCVFGGSLTFAPLSSALHFNIKPLGHALAVKEARQARHSRFRVVGKGKSGWKGAVAALGKDLFGKSRKDTEAYLTALANALDDVDATALSSASSSRVPSAAALDALRQSIRPMRRGTTPRTIMRQLAATYWAPIDDDAVAARRRTAVQGLAALGFGSRRALSGVLAGKTPVFAESEEGRRVWDDVMAAATRNNIPIYHISADPSPREFLLGLTRYTATGGGGAMVPISVYAADPELLEAEMTRYETVLNAELDADRIKHLKGASAEEKLVWKERKLERKRSTLTDVGYEVTKAISSAGLRQAMSVPGAQNMRTKGRAKASLSLDQDTLDLIYEAGEHACSVLDVKIPAAESDGDDDQVRRLRLRRNTVDTVRALVQPRRQTRQATASGGLGRDSRLFSLDDLHLVLSAATPVDRDDLSGRRLERRIRSRVAPKMAQVYLQDPDLRAPEVNDVSLVSKTSRKELYLERSLRELLSRAGATFDEADNTLHGALVFDMGAWGSEFDPNGKDHFPGSPPFLSGSAMAPVVARITQPGMGAFFLADEMRTSMTSSRSHTESKVVTEVTSIAPKEMKRAIKAQVAAEGGRKTLYSKLLALAADETSPYELSRKQRLAVDDSINNVQIDESRAPQGFPAKEFVRVGLARRRHLVRTALKRYIRHVLDEAELQRMMRDCTWRMKGVQRKCRLLCSTDCGCGDHLAAGEDVCGRRYHPITIGDGQHSTTYLFLTNRDVAAVRSITLRTHTARTDRIPYAYLSEKDRGASSKTKLTGHVSSVLDPVAC